MWIIKFAIITSNRLCIDRYEQIIYIVVGKVERFWYENRDECIKTMGH